MSIAILWRETRQSWRGLLRRPGYLLLAVLTLALGVATTTGVFALLDQALLKPLPFPQPDRLVTLGYPMGPVRNVAAPGYYPPLQRLPGVQSAGLLRAFPVNTNIARGDTAEVVSSISADRGFLDTLGLPLAHGRNFNDEENRPGGPKAVILGHGFWQRRFGGDPAVIGQTLQVEGRAVPVIGVLPAGFQWADPFDMIQSLQPDPNATDLSTNELIVARMRPDADLRTVSAQTAEAIKGLLRNHAAMNERWWQRLLEDPPNAVPLKGSVYTAQSGNMLWLFFGAGACVLLIAAINLASLMLLRALGRSHDSAVRAALGAPLGRLSLPALAEGLLVGVLGSAVGLLLAWVGLRLFGGLVPVDWLRGEPVRLGATSVAFALGAGVASALLAALLGVLRGRRRNLAAELVGGGRGGWSLHAGRLGRALVIAQVGVAVFLLVVAALFGRTLQTLSAIPMGFEARSAVTFTMAPVRERYATAADAIALGEQVTERLRRMPGIAQAGLSSNPPAGRQLNWNVSVAEGQDITVQYRLATPGFLDVFRIPILAGRDVAQTDAAGAEPVCLVSAAFAERYLDGDALGRIVTLPDDGGGNSLRMRVVGVVGDIRQAGPAEPAPPMVYQPMAQMTEPMWQLLRGFGAMTFAVRTQAEGLGADERALRQAIAEVAPQQPIADLEPMALTVAATTREQRLSLLLVGLFAGLALLLAAVGLYAVMATAVAARTHEFGVRAALGAEPARLLRQVLREAALQIGIGLAIGLGIAMALSRLIQRLLFGVQVADPVAIGLVLLILGGVGLLAALVPARRAAAVSPMQALRT
ncbi:ADOP family duplicated permease [Xanthomonas sp. XNM01]|uniref:ADOP family duplicated permease n=1 Tax=Xanthomonas sp. XNM01 TaxID=2769289 RepID=UPI0017824351|nr:ADOP family duplicated permease [Xanthomonas sp. XNM01]MBD9369777.1 ABC transporter permease [Xanthomonas sp. XNM01]